MVVCGIPAAVSERVKIVGFTESSYRPMAFDWYDRLEDLGYDTQVLVAMDDASFQSTRATGRRVERFGTFHGVGSIWKIRLHYLHAAAHANQSVLVSDTDVLFTPRLDLDSMMGRADVVHSYGTTWPPEAYKANGFVVCGCFGLYRATAATRHYLDLAVRRCGSAEYCDDQRVLNMVYMYDLDTTWTEVERPTVDRIGYTPSILFPETNNYSCS